MRTLRNRLASTRDMLVDLAPGLGPDDVWLHAGPITHASGLFVLPHVVVGACQVVMAEVRAGRCARPRRSATVSPAPSSSRPCSSGWWPSGPRTAILPGLRRVAYAGAPMQPERIGVADDAFGGRLVQFYGMVEAIPPVTVLSPADHRVALDGRRPEILGSAGRACMGAELEVVDEDGQPVPDGEHGELVISGDHVMAGYWGMADESGKALRDGRLWTGDMAWRDDEGYVTIIDRKNDMIITGGYNVYPREVEDVIAGDPSRLRRRRRRGGRSRLGRGRDRGRRRPTGGPSRPGGPRHAAAVSTWRRSSGPKRIEPVDTLPDHVGRQDQPQGRAGRARGGRRWPVRPAPDCPAPDVFDAATAEAAGAAEPGRPGEPPFTRGITPPALHRPAVDHGAVRRPRLGAGDQPRYRQLLEQGQTGFSVALDLPTQMGLDSDHPARQRRGREGRCGDRLARRHGGPVPRHPPRPDPPDPNDGQRHRPHLAGARRRARRTTRRRPEPDPDPDPERRAQGVHRPRHLHLPAGSRPRDRRPGHRALRATTCRAGPR